MIKGRTRRTAHIKNEPKKRLAIQLVLTCYSCEQPRSFIVSSIHEIPAERPPEEYTFASCSQCKKPSVFYREDMGDGFENENYYRVYPAEDRHLGFALPKIVRDSYEEAVRCDSARTPTACVVMVGRTLEAVCKEFDPGTKNILRGLKSMYDKGLISQEILEWSNELRVLRNLGAHATRQSIDRTDARGALDFLQAILEILYDLRPKFEQFRRRRKSEGTLGASSSDSEEDPTE
jgi:hypothetical protein